MAVLVVFTIYMLMPKKEIPAIQDQLTKLSQIQDNLKDVDEYVSDQIEKLKTAEIAMSELEKEKMDMEPIVKANRDTITAIIGYLLKKAIGMRVWTERAYGFIIGVLSSIVAGLILTQLRSGKSKRSQQN